MADTHPHALLLILSAAALAPLLNELPVRPRIPLVVLELVLGMLIGPHGLDLVAAEGSIRTLAALGLSFLFFQAGIHLDFSALWGRPLTLGIIGWLISISLALMVFSLLSGLGLIDSSALAAVALSTTAIGTLMPVLRESGDLQSPFGRLVLGAGAVAEFGPIVLCSLLLSGLGGVVHRSEILTAFVCIVLVCAVVALRLRPLPVIDLLSRTLHRTSQLPIRLSIALLGASVVLADVLGLDLLLGAFAAGSLVGLVSRGSGAELFHHKLDAIGFGFLIPIFFIISGTQVDLPELFAHDATLLRVPIFLVALLIIRGAPALLYRRDLGLREGVALALYCATTLPLVVVITHIGTATGRITSGDAAALVGAGILSVLLFPLLAGLLRSAEERGPSSDADPQDDL